jgi:hypothetical protein
MSNRKQNFSGGSSNPATKFIEWKSDKKGFSYYDKDKKETVDIKLPLTFLVLDILHTVKGWHKASSSAIYSNEVKNIGTDPIKVKSFKGGDIAEGIYKEIRETIKGANGHYSLSIYIMLPDFTIANLQLKGGSISTWGELTKGNRNRLGDEWVTVSKTKQGKNGGITYNMPVFNFAQSLDESESEQADKCFDTVEAYFADYFKGKITPELSSSDTTSETINSDTDNRTISEDIDVEEDDFLQNEEEMDLDF